MNGTRLAVHTLACPVASWFNEGKNDILVLNGVPFGLFALLALDDVCYKTFCRYQKLWTLIFKNSQICAEALEVKFDKNANGRPSRNGRPLPVAIRMSYSHRTPGELTVEIIDVMPQDD
jgi:hypothetical protein